MIIISIPFQHYKDSGFKTTDKRLEGFILRLPIYPSYFFKRFRIHSFMNL